MGSAPRVSTEGRPRAIPARSANGELEHLLVLGFLFLSSLVAHAAVWGILGLLPPLAQLFSEQPSVEVEVVEIPAEEPVAAEPEPVLPDPEPILPPPPPPPRARHEPPPPEPEAPPPPPAQEAIADFTGETLTNDSSDSGFSSSVGNGQEMHGPIGPPNSAVTGRQRQGRPGGAPGGTGDNPDGIVQPEDLSRPPAAPASLASILQRNYPRRAQELGIEGEAFVRLRIDHDGRPRPLAVVSETADGFGEACLRTLRESPRFDAPLDREGRAVDTIVRFRCSFAIRAF